MPLKDVISLGTLLEIGGAALAAKWYITRVIDQKMKEAELASNYETKITLVKSASDLRITYKLVKAAMIKAVRT